MKESSIIYASTVEASKKLSKEQFVEFWRGYFDYALNDIPFEPKDITVEMLWIATKPNIDVAVKRYNACVENGKKGGAPKGNSNARKNNLKQPKEQPNNQPNIQPKEQPKNNLNVDVNEDIDKEDNVNVNEIDTTTRDTINNPDNFNQDKEVNKQNVVIEEKEEIKETNVDKEDITPVTINGVESIPVFPENFKSKRMDKLLEEFKSSEDNTKHPTKEQLLCMTYLENLSFSKTDFKSILDKPKSNGYYIPSSWFELMCCVLSKLKPIATKYNFKSSGIPDCEEYQEMIGSYLEKNIDYFKIKIPSK